MYQAPTEQELYAYWRVSSSWSQFIRSDFESIARSSTPDHRGFILRNFLAPTPHLPRQLEIYPRRLAPRILCASRNNCTFRAYLLWNDIRQCDVRNYYCGSVWLLIVFADTCFACNFIPVQELRKWRLPPARFPKCRPVPQVLARILKILPQVSQVRDD